MPRSARASRGEICYHTFNRGNSGARVFHDAADYDRMCELMAEVGVRIPMRILAFCLMPNHFHMVLWPFEDGDLSRWMKRLMNLHVRAHRQRWETIGHVWQGRFKAFPIEQDRHLISVLRYVEANPVSASLTSSAELWRWSSAYCRAVPGSAPAPSAGPIELPSDWYRLINETEPEESRRRLVEHMHRQVPLGSEAWTLETARALGLPRRIDGPGRPPIR